MLRRFAALSVSDIIRGMKKKRKPRKPRALPVINGGGINFGWSELPESNVRLKGLPKSKRKKIDPRLEGLKAKPRISFTVTMDVDDLLRLSGKTKS